jgi:3-phosphoshikimate 1-carboxyvinyltransferase
MQSVMEQLGVVFETTNEGLVVKPPQNYLVADKTHDFFIGNAGTTIRFLTTFLSLIPGGVFVLKGEPRMHERPIRDLVDPLVLVGADIQYLEKEGYPPLKIAGKKYSFEKIVLDGSKSSQYISSILMHLPLISPKGVVMVENLVSKPYIDTTINALEAFGIKIRHRDYKEFFLAEGSYQPRTYDIPADASSASYFWGKAFLKNMPLELNLGTNCLQGDYLFTQILREMGGVFEMEEEVTRFICRGKNIPGIAVDMNEIPDTVQTLAIMASFANSPTTIVNVANLRIKETDRLEALVNELTRMGVKAIAGADFIKIIPNPEQLYFPIEVETYHDHRMAMSFALARERVPGLRIGNPSVVSKSFPDFWDYWQEL